MSVEKFYDPEDVARSWSEINTPRAIAPVDADSLFRWALPRIMAYYSKKLWGVWWVENAHVVLPEMVPEIAKMAEAIGEICVSSGSDKNSEEVKWEKYNPR